MTAPDLDALERAAQAATPGPWYQSGSPWFSTGSLVLSGSPDRHAGYMIVDTDPLDYREDIPDGEVADPDDDAAYIAAANPAAIRSLIARLREAERQRDEARAALETISESHIPSMPMTAADDELVWAQRHVAHLRRIALSALPPPAGSETGEA